MPQEPARAATIVANSRRFRAFGHPKIPILPSSPVSLTCPSLARIIAKLERLPRNSSPSLACDVPGIPRGSLSAGRVDSPSEARMSAELDNTTNTLPSSLDATEGAPDQSEERSASASASSEEAAATAVAPELTLAAATVPGPAPTAAAPSAENSASAAAVAEEPAAATEESAAEGDEISLEAMGELIEQYPTPHERGRRRAQVNRGQSRRDFRIGRGGRYRHKARRPDSRAGICGQRRGSAAGHRRRPWKSSG